MTSILLRSIRTGRVITGLIVIQDAYGHTTDMTVVAGSQYSYSVDKCLFMPAEFTGGLEYNFDRAKGRNVRI